MGGGQRNSLRCQASTAWPSAPKPDATTYAALMRGYEAAGQWPEAVRTFREMQASGLPPAHGGGWQVGCSNPRGGGGRLPDYR